MQGPPRFCPQSVIVAFCSTGNKDGYHTQKKIYTSKMEHCYTAHVTSSAASDEEAEPKPSTVQLSIVICPRLFIASNKHFDGEKKRTLEQLLAQ